MRSGIAIICLLAIGCAGVPRVKPVDAATAWAKCDQQNLDPKVYRPCKSNAEKNCMRDNQYVPAKDYQIVVTANGDCIKTLLKTTDHNARAANANRPDNFWEDAQETAVGVFIGILIGIIAAL